MLKLITAISLLTGVAHASTQTVWDHHIETWTKRDVAGIVADYSDDAVVVMNHHSYRGRKEITALFRDLFTFFDGAQEHVIAPADIVGRFVYLTWHARIGGLNYPLGTDTFVIENDRIVFQTISFVGVKP